MYGALWLAWQIQAEMSTWCPSIPRNRQQLCEPCVLPYSQDDLCDVGLTCHFYMRRCVTVGSKWELSEDMNELQELCPVKADDRSTWWARCITNACVVEGRIKICPHLCINPDFPCYWVKDCHVQDTMIEDCDRQCQDQAWLLHKANNRFWQDSRINASTTCEEAKSRFGCAGEIGSEVRWICPETCSTDACSIRCNEMVPREEPREGVACQAVVPALKTCAEATSIGQDCHCSCAEYYAMQGGSLGYMKTLIQVELTVYVGEEFDLHVTGIRLHLDYLTALPTARIKLVSDDSCSKEHAESVSGLSCMGKTCVSAPTFSAAYYQKWKGLTISTCDTFMLCYCSEDCGITSSWKKSGTIKATRDRIDDWIYFPMENCWDGPFEIDYPGPLAGVTETEQTDYISIVLISCGTTNWETLINVLIEYLKHRSMGSARPKVSDISPTVHNVSSGYPAEDNCQVIDLQIVTYSQESRGLMHSRIQIIADDNTQFVDTFFTNLQPVPSRIRLQIKTFGSPRETESILGVREKPQQPVVDTEVQPEEEKSFFTTAAGIAIIIIASVAVGGTAFFVGWNWYFTRVIHGTVEVSEAGYRKKVTPDQRITEAPEVPNVFSFFAAAFRDIVALARNKWKRTLAPKAWQRHEAPSKWQGATSAWEEVPMNCPPFPGATVRVSGLNSAEYNGMRGLIKEGPNEKQRYLVEIVIQEENSKNDRETKDLSLKEDNLLVVEEVEVCSPASYSAKAARSPKNWASGSKPVPKSKPKMKGKPAPPAHSKTYRATAKENATRPKPK